MAANWMEALSPAQAGSERIVLRMLGGPVVAAGSRLIEIPEVSKRVLTFVTLHHGPVERRSAAGALWPGSPESRAAASLRSALWRLRATGLPLLRVGRTSIAIDERVSVDVHLLDDWATRLITGCPSPADLTVRPAMAEAFDLLPGWYDDWALLERERLRQRMLHAVEVLGRVLVRSGRCADAVDAVMVALAADPLRESTQRVLLEAHVAGGNLAEARRCLEAYRRLVRRELGVTPSKDLAVLVGLVPTAVG
ncbi:transcriptional regulator [Actinoplanes sp. LDG1-06]|uniref:Transcriptional regulator n=1 Tax=Paractinoplanes ovalisporus TaxID=2810368 RepID=A0ABS2ALS7_9ACTN|nr:BTAD domain-containing putative transcriptional regulator [Actinoplanes ovalisporus]MBM2620817.1 transcriptional regulator [Actinoplanes ovalisporus]